MLNFDWFNDIKDVMNCVGLILGNAFDSISSINKKKCEFCNKLFNSLYEVKVYQPFSDTPSVFHLCEECENIEDVYYCESCGRDIFHSNGMRINIRFNEEEECFTCVACLQKNWLKNGMESFKDADFFSYDELNEHGFTEYNSYFCCSKESYENVEKIFNDLKAKGNLVINNIKASGLGFEHYISLHIKPKEVN